MAIETNYKWSKQYVTAYICDSCKKRYEPSGEGAFEFQEMLVWETTGGYGSIFGDGQNIRVILCQRCVEKHLGKYIEYLDSFCG